MKETLLVIKAIVAKDLLSELRSKQVLPSMVVLAALFIWILRLVTEAAALDPGAMGAAAIWLAFLFSGLMAQGHLFSVEEIHGCMAGLLLAPVEPGTLYLAKLLVSVALLCAFELFLVPMAAIAFELEVLGSAGQIAGLLLAANFALAGVGTLFSAMVHVSSVRGSLLNILVLIILLPVMVPAIGALSQALGLVGAEGLGTSILAVAGSFSQALAYLVAFDVVFITAGWLLFGFMVTE